jgi:hypothetical protein
MILKLALLFDRKMFRKRKTKQEKPEFVHDLNALGYKIDEEQRFRTLDGQ